jgi:hypothetical protein
VHAQLDVDDIRTVLRAVPKARSRGASSGGLRALGLDPALAPTEAGEVATRRVVGPRPRLARAGTDAAALAPGALIAGQYRILAELGAGAMGVVYRARDVRLGRDVAIKLCSALGPRALARFEREAAALARLSHPNAVTVYQVGEQDGRLFIVMEAVAGGTARAWAKGRSWREIVALYAAAGEGLAAAHAAGLVHRDFKPDNVLVGDDGRPRVADFGLAHAGDAVRALGSAHVTGTGAVLGTPAYMPPEQRAGGSLDARADQYAFCAALWEALFEELPYSNPGATSSEELRTGKHARSALGGAVPRRVVAALRRGLSAVPADRWPSMAALCAELRHDPRPRRRRRLAAVVLAAFAATLLAAFAVAFAVLHAGGAAPAGSPSEEAQHWRAACLAWSRAELDGVLAELADAGCRAPSLEAREQLSRPERCAAFDASGSAASAPPPGPAALAKIERAARVIGRAEVALAGGARARASLLTNDALALARAAGWRVQIAQALALRALALEISGRTTEARASLDEAAAIAPAAHGDAVAAISPGPGSRLAQ